MSAQQSETKGSKVEIQAVGKAFQSLTVLDQVNLTIEPGQFVAIIGRSGSGKSTLLKILAGLERVDEGEAWLDGWKIDGISRETTVMFQDDRLLPWKNVLENATLGLKETSRAQAEDLLAQVGLKQHTGYWPSELSGGQKQRAALARALLRRPRLLLLDEPLGALDALTRLEMQQLIEGLWQSQSFTTILVTHDVTEAVRLADRIILLENGSISLDIAIGLNRPRRHTDPAFTALEQQVLDRIMIKNNG